MSWQLGAGVVLALALGSGFAWYERSRPDARLVALVATLAAFAALGRVAFAALPNVKPTSDIVLISGYALGAGPGFVVGALAGLSSNFFFGQGPWTPWQMAGWGATGALGACLAVAGGHRVDRQPPGRWPLALACALAGFAFTALQDVGDWVTYSDHSGAQLAVYVGKGLGFDAVHATGSLLFALAFGPALARSVARFAARLEVRWRPASGTLGLVLALAAAGGWAGAARLPPARADAGLQGPIHYLLRAQNPDGGFGPAPGQPSSPLYSGWAALGLASAGISPAGVARDGHSLAAYLENGRQGEDPGSLERTVLALRAGGLPAAAALRALQRSIRGDGSVADQVNLTAFAVLALRAAGAPVGGGTVAWLVRQQDGDGGFNYATAGGASDIDDTAAALEALAGSSAPGAGRARSRAVRFIASHQGRDGGFPSSPGQPSNAQSTAWAVQGLLAAGGPAEAVSRALAYLGSLIAPDGHVEYARAQSETPVWVTAEALMALERRPLPLRPVAAPAVAEPGGAAAGRGGGAKRSRGGGGATLARRGGGTSAARPGRRPLARGDAATAALIGDLGALSALALAPVGL